MKGDKMEQRLLYISIGGYFLMSVCILLVSKDELGYFPGVLFWIGLMIGTVTQMLLSGRKRRFYTALQMPCPGWKSCGLIRFRSNRLAGLSDAVLLISSVVLMVIQMLTYGTDGICYILYAVCLFSFCMHCIFNGSTYFYLKKKSNIRNSHKQNKHNK